MATESVPGGRRGGTRFRLFPQAPYGAATAGKPETVWLSPPAGSVGPGPADDRMYVVDPIGKSEPYGFTTDASGMPYLPPWRGPIRRPAIPDPAGHFDHLEIGTPEFEMAHTYGCVRFALDIWERYVGQRIPWHFASDFEQLEIALLRQLDNATAGYGFMEIGSYFRRTGAPLPFSLNLDVLAHEVGHLILYSEIGLPSLEDADAEFFGFHESAGDLAALICALHFDSVVDKVLRKSRGNLYTFNELNRFAEVSDHGQIRNASNSVKLSDFATGWSDEHALSLPLTGAVFDILVDLFHENLLDRGLITSEVEALMDRVERDPARAPLIQALFDEAYPAHGAGFKEALLLARDYLGRLLADTWRRLSPDRLSYVEVGETLLDVDYQLSGARYQQLIFDDLSWRDIGVAVVGPRLRPPGPESHAYSVRTLTPQRQRQPRRRSYYERWQRAHGAGGAIGSGP